MKIAIIVLSFFSIVSNCLAQEEYVYQSKWKVLYKDAYGSSVMAQPNTPQAWVIPNKGCGLSPVVQPEKNHFQRVIFCGEEKKTLDCIAKEKETKCRIDLLDIVLIVEINRYPTAGTWRKNQIEKEKKNYVPY